MLVSASIPNLVSGISQQASDIRRETQAEAQVNMDSSVKNGLSNRPTSFHQAKISSIPSSGAYLHTINRDTTERYKVVITNGDLKVFDLDGTEKTVAFPDGKGYLVCNTPRSDYVALTVADYTFIANKTILPAMTADVTPTRDPEAMITVKQGNYGKTYKVTIDGVVKATYTTPDGGSAVHSTQIDTTYIATQLYTGLNSSLGAGWTVTQVGNAIHLSYSITDFNIEVVDGFNGNAMTVVKGQTQTFTDLPNKAVDGFHAKIVGENSAVEDDYYVEFMDGVWVETLGQDLTYKLDPETMPHTLIRESDGTFTFKEATWGEREVGDEDSSPEPSFIGKKINDLFFFKNRLGLLADESYIMSRAGEFFHFWRQSATSVLDSDPIDVSVTTNKVSILRHAVPFNKTLLLFADQTQFEVAETDLLTPTTISIPPTTSYVASLTAKPVPAGRYVYFAFPRGLYDGVREYGVATGNADIQDAPDITAHVPDYIPAGVFKMTSASNENILAMVTSGDSNKIWIYKYFYNGDQKLQDSWSYWEFDADADILDIDFIDSRLQMVVSRSDGLFLEDIDIASGAKDTGCERLYRIDRKVTEADLSPSYNSGTGYTTFTLPYEADGVDLHVICRSGNSTSYPEGYILTVFDRPTSTTFRVWGDHSATKLFAGLRVTYTYTFSYFHVREQSKGGAVIPVGSGRLQVKYLTLFFEGSSFFKVEVTPSGRDTYTYTFNGRTIGSVNNVIGEVATVGTGKFRVPIYARNTEVEITITSDSHLPCAFTHAEWEGFFTLRSRRL